MEPKKKGRGKKGKELKKHGPKKLARSEYLANVAELNNVLAQVRKDTSAIESVYIDTEHHYEQVQEDMNDIIQYLDHESKVCEEEMAKCITQIDNYTRKLQNDNKYYKEIHKKMDEEYEVKNTKLTEKIQSVNAKLNSVEEIRRQREDFLKRRENLAVLIAEMLVRHKQEIYEAEKKAITEQDKFQQEMESRVERLALDFRKATDIRVGETSNRIIGDNIKMGNMLTCQQEIMTKTRDNYTNMKNIEKRAAMDLELKEQEYNMVCTRYSDNSAKIMELVQMAEDLMKKIEDLKKLIKINRALKRKIAELECYYKELEEEYDTLKKAVEEVDELMATAKGNLRGYQRHIVKLQIILFEAAKKVREAIECEKVQLPAKKRRTTEGEERSVQTELDEMEEEKEQIYARRESLIAEILRRLQAPVFSKSDLHLTTSSGDSHDVEEYVAASTENTPTSQRSAERGDNDRPKLSLRSQRESFGITTNSQ